MKKVLRWFFLKPVWHDFSIAAWAGMIIVASLIAAFIVTISENFFVENELLNFIYNLKLFLAGAFWTIVVLLFSAMLCVYLYEKMWSRFATYSTILWRGRIKAGIAIFTFVTIGFFTYFIWPTQYYYFHASKQVMDPGSIHKKIASAYYRCSRFNDDCWEFDQNVGWRKVASITRVEYFPPKPPVDLLADLPEGFVLDAPPPVDLKAEGFTPLPKNDNNAQTSALDALIAKKP